MAAARKSHRYLSGGGGKINPATSDDDGFEFDEAEVWGTYNNDDDGADVLSDKKNHVSSNNHPGPPAGKTSRRSGSKIDHRLPAGPKSLPVNVPDWSKILGSEYKGRAAGEFEEEEDDGGGNDQRIEPPHEYLAKKRGESLSVHEGEGRTLKGRDLSRVRDAVWKKLGFQD